MNAFPFSPVIALARLAPLLLAALLLGGCGALRGIDEHVRIDPSGKNIVYRDAWVQRVPPEVHVRPQSQAPRDLKVLFIPFRVTQPMDNPTVLGYSTARVFWQTWLTMRLFPNMEFSGDDTPYRRDRAVALARARGADLVIGGFVTYVYAGGTAGDSQIALQLEAHDVRSGQLVWSMAQGGKIAASVTTDYFIFATQYRLPSDPLQAITRAIASDMGQEVGNWIAGPAQQSDMQRFDQGTQNLLLAPRDPVPAPRDPFKEAQKAGPEGARPESTF
jgi:hypothetical protein